MIKGIINFFRNKNQIDEDLKLSIGQMHSKINSKLDKKNINEYEFKCFSQWGEDGIIDYLIENLSIENKTFIEFGVENYSEANTKFLLMSRNWDGFILDSSSKNIEDIKNSDLYWKYELTAKANFITKENINIILEQSNFKKKIGLLSIDIDGNDYWVWKEIKDFDPSIVIIEYNARLGNEKNYVVPYKKDFERNKAHYSGIYYGASIQALVKLGNEKGYAFICCNNAGNNLFFVKRDLLNNKVKELSIKDGFIKNKFRESRNKNGDLIFLTKKKEEEIIFNLPLIEV